MKSILARRLSYMVEKYNLLPPEHMGGRKGVTHVLPERIHATWKIATTHIASVLFLEVLGAFDDVSHAAATQLPKKEN